jgi:CheY-like chemotaxis protein/HPt (histidine-containing phosphotransfer) domain-containing protein
MTGDDKQARMLVAAARLRDPLRTLLLELQKLHDLGLVAQHASLLETVRQSGHGLAGLLDDLLDGVVAKQAVTPPPPPPRAGQRPHILLVEDSPTNRAVALAMLKSAPLVIDAVENGMQAIERLRETPYDLVLMDVAMPVMDGLDATRAIRALDGPAAKVPVVAMTANALSQDEARCRDAGMDDYLTKPIERANLLAMLSRWLGPLEGPRPVIDEMTIARLLQEVEPGSLNRLLGVFLDEARNRATRILAAVARLDAAEAIAQIEYEAHALKGSAQTFGAATLATRAGNVETAIRVRALDTVRSQAGALAGMVADAEHAYRARGYFDGTAKPS